MKALLSKQPGPPETLVLEEIDDPVAGPGEVVITVKAAGVNFPDALIIEDKYQLKPPRPFAPGGELAGVIESVGEGVSHLKVGQKVAALSGFNAFAEKFKVQAMQVTPVHDDMPFEEASTFVMTYGTTYYGLKDRGHLQEGETLLILGAAGGIGSAAIELGKAMGARVIAAVSSEEKAAFAKECGADETVVYSPNALSKDESRALAKTFKEACNGGADVVFDVVGGDYCEPALRCLNWDGRYMVIGFASSIPAPPLNLVLLKSTSIVGVAWGAGVMRDPKSHMKNMKDLMGMYAKGQIRPRISARYSLADAGQAIRAMIERRVQGKIAIIVDQD